MNFDEAIEHVLSSEGGYVNNPNDSGGETKYGISKRSYPKLDIKNLTRAQAKAIYRTDFWDKVKADQLASAVRFHVFDFAVNAGVSTAIKTLQFAAGSKKDGVLGPNTIKGSQRVSARDFGVARIRHYTALARDRPKDRVFLDGWLIRTLDVTLLSTK
ncbi:MAG TPA: glycosyl hydrolase 108 family protein [Dyadobacter sp.]|jgi:lysozyme family protein|nr:glycosyl hydrolase 108 family protein [Dyadobacter sp.]